MKRFWITVGAIAAVGLILALAALPFNVHPNFYWDDKGIHLTDYAAEKNITKNNTQEFKDIDINVNSANVELVPSDTYGYEIKGKDSYYISDRINDGKLTICEDNKYIVSFFNLINTSPQIKVFYPPNAAFNDLKLSATSGKINVKGINAKTLSSHVTSGESNIESSNFEKLNVSASSGHIRLLKCSMDNFICNITSGNLNALDISSKGSNLHVTSGLAVINSNEALGENIIDITSGKVNYTIKGKETDYNRTVKTTSGSVYINGNRNKENYISQSAQNSINAKAASGNIHVDFVTDFGYAME